MMFIVSFVLVFQPVFALQKQEPNMARGKFEGDAQFIADDLHSQFTPYRHINLHGLQEVCDTSCLSPYLGYMHGRIGEAANPGPEPHCDSLSIRTFNPTQLLGNEEVISQWPRGVWTAAETSHTVAAEGVIKARLKKHDINVQFGNPVEKLNNNAGIYRGRALGCANISALPLQPYPQMDGSDFMNICRSSDALVQLGAGLSMYSGVIYGPTSTNQYYADPERVFRRATVDIIERACMYRGPAVISGDFNRDLDQCYFWENMSRRGWHDAAVLAMQMFGYELEPTCRERTRRSFILINSHLAEALRSCQVVEQYCFDSHPVLEAVFDVKVHHVPRKVWTLPRSSDDILMDPQILEESCKQGCEKFHGRFIESLCNKEEDVALAYLANVYESACQSAAVTTDGHKADFPAGCLKKATANLTKKRNIMMPRLKMARSGDPNYALCQASVWIRQRVTQVRRLKSLVRQLQSFNHSQNWKAGRQCEQLWNNILHAAGFAKNFQWWCLTSLKMFVPGELPDLLYIDELLLALDEVVHKDVLRERSQQFVALKKEYAMMHSQVGPMHTSRYVTQVPHR